MSLIKWIMQWILENGDFVGSVIAGALVVIFKEIYEFLKGHPRKGGFYQYMKDYFKKFKKDLSTPKSRRNLLFIFILVVTAGFAAITLINGETEININHNSDTAHIEENINGTARNIPTGDEIWIFVHPHTVNKYYPQRSNAVIQNEEWSLSSVRIGTENDANQEFDIIAMLADRKAQEEINSYFAECEKTGEWPGMDKVPDSAKEYNRITVTRLPAPEPATGEIQVSSSPTSASVSLDDTDKGKTPTTLNNIEQGQHTVTLKLAGYEDWSQTVIVEAAKTILIYADLIPIPIKGNISISSSPDEAKVYIDDTYKGETPTILNNIEKGFHEITLKLEGYKDWNKTINVDVGKTTPVSAELKPTIIPPPPPSPPEIQITYPLNTAKIKETITGTAKNIPEGQTAWLIIYPHTAHKYYPQNKLDISNEKWSYPAQFGESEDKDTQFDIIVLLADKEAHAELANYLKTCIETTIWPGTMTLPVGVKECARVTVTRE